MYLMLIIIIFHYRDREEIVKLLLNAGANVNAKNKKGITPLMIAVAKGHQKAAMVFLKQPNIDPQQQVIQFNAVIKF